MSEGTDQRDTDQVSDQSAEGSASREGATPEAPPTEATPAEAATSTSAPEGAPAEPAAPDAPETGTGTSHAEAAEADAAADLARPGSTAGQGATESAPDAPQAVETAGADASAGAEGDSAAASEGGEGEPAAAGEGGEAAAGDEAAAGEDGAKKKKRRRRRKKKKGGEGEVTAASEAERERKEHTVPFLRFFEGEHAVSKRHAFAVGEVVAGRVTRVEDGTVLVDLFGKATAVIDDQEPRDVPIMPEPVEEPSEPEVAAEAGEQPVQSDAAAPPGTEPEPASASVAAPEGVAGAPGDAGPTTQAGEVPFGEAVTEEQVSPPVEAPVPPTEAAALTRTEEPPEAAALTRPEELQTAAASTGTQEPDVAAQAEVEEQGAEAAAPAEPEQPAGPPPEPRVVGEIVRGRIGAVSESGHVALVNRVVDRAAAKARLEEARENKRRVPGIVFGFNRGGFDVLVEGIRAFCPASGMALEHISEPEPWVGKKLEFTVPPKKGSAHGIVVSRKNIIEREQRKLRKARLKSLEKGQRLTGRVTQVREFGLFVDIGDGLEGLVHQSELSWTRGARPADVAKPGDQVEVEVLETRTETKKDKQGRVSLSMRTLQPDPWDEHQEILREGTVRKCKVVSTTEFGAFMEIVPGIEGLLHVTELGRDLKHANQAVQEGDELDVIIERVDRKQRRISLSKLTAAEAKAVEEGTLDLSQRPKSLKPGSHVAVVIDKVEHHGMQVQVRGVLGRRGRGYLPNRELGTLTGEDRRRLQPGAEIEVKVIGVDRDGGLRVSIKGKEVDEERKAVREYRKEAAKQGLGTFGDLLRQKLQGAQESNEGGG